MKEHIDQIQHWLEEKKEFGISTVIKTWGSSPRPIGSAMLISKTGEMLGSVSGGCVENDVIRQSLPSISEGSGKKLFYGISDEDAWTVGLSCGGSMEVFSQPFLAFSRDSENQKVWEKLNRDLTSDQSCVLITPLVEEKVMHTLLEANGRTVGAKAAEFVLDKARQALAERKTQVVQFEGREYFLQVFPRKNELLIIGAAHITVDLVRLGKMYDFRTIVIDPREFFTQNTQFAVPPDQIINKYPSQVLGDFILDPNTYVAVLSHDPKIDDNALHILLRSDVAYIGALGSRRTHEKRIKRLRDAGFTDGEISRIRSPIGIDIHAKKPREIALSIMSEMIAEQNKYL